MKWLLQTQNIHIQISHETYQKEKDMNEFVVYEPNAKPSTDLPNKNYNNAIHWNQAILKNQSTRK